MLEPPSFGVSRRDRDPVASFPLRIQIDLFPFGMAGLAELTEVSADRLAQLRQLLATLDEIGVCLPEKSKLSAPP